MINYAAEKKNGIEVTKIASVLLGILLGSKMIYVKNIFPMQHLTME